MIPYGRQDITEEDIKAVVEVLKSDFLTQGPKVPEFEKLASKYCNSKYAVAVNSATSALHISCLALGVKKGDIVWTAANTFVASSNAALYCGATVDFVDINEHDFNISIEALKQKLNDAEKVGKLPKVVIPVHMCGQSCDMKAIKELSNKYGFKIIEDASHAVGGKYQDFKVGSCQYSDITVFSFHPVKIITTGEGGMAFTNDNHLYQLMCLYRSHGITRDRDCMKNNPDGDWYYEQQVLGLNYRMTDIHAALGISQFKRVDQNVAFRNKIAQDYNEMLSDLPLKLPKVNDFALSSYHLYVIRLEKEVLCKHRIVFEKLREKNILVNLHYIPVYHHPYYESIGFEKGYCPNAETFYKSAISIPIFPKLTSEEQSFVVKEIKSALFN